MSARALPGVVVVDLGDRAARAVRELLLDRAQMHALLLERMALREVELEARGCRRSRWTCSDLVWPQGCRKRPAPTVDEPVPRLARPLVVLGALVCALVVSFPAAGAGTRTVLHYGDSLAVGTDIYLDRYLADWTVRSSTDVSRHAARRRRRPGG